MRIISFFLYFFILFNVHIAKSLYPNQKKGDVGILNLNYIQSDGNNHWGLTDETFFIYGVTDRFELQAIASFAYAQKEFGLGYGQLKAKYQLYKNNDNTFFLAGAFSLKSPHWLSNVEKLQHMSSGPNWKPAMHLILDWIPNKYFALMSQIYYTDARQYSSITLELHPIFNITNKVDIRFFYKGVYNLQHFKNGSIDFWEAYATYQITKKLRIGAGIYYWHLMNDNKFDKQRLSAITYLYYNFQLDSLF